MAPGDFVASTGTWLQSVPRVIWAVAGLLIVLAVLSPSSVAPIHLLDITRQAAPLIVSALGQMIVMLCGGLDLSVGATITLVDVVAAQLTSGKPEAVPGVVLLCLVIGLLVGAVNGACVTWLKIPSFIATLGMNTLVLGIALVYSGGAPRGGVPQSLRFWGNGFLVGIPAATVVWCVVAAAVGVVLQQTAFGRYLYATGSSSRAARLSGINTSLMQASTFVVSGICAAIAGLLMAAYIGTASLDIGNDFMINTIAAAVLGGTAFEGGRGSLPGTIFGCLFLELVSSVLAVVNLTYGGKLMIQGLIIALAILANREYLNERG